MALVLKRLFWTRLVPALACLKAVAGLAAFFVSFRSAPPDPTFLYPLYLFFLLEFGVTAALLVLGGRADPRAQSLGFFFLIGLTAWANGPLFLAASTMDAPWDHLLFAVKGLHLDGLMAYYLWTFVRDFPTQPRSPRVLRRVDVIVTVSAAVGIALFVLNLLRPLAAETGLAKLFALLMPMRGGGIYYGLIMPLTAAAIVYLVWKGRSLEDAEYRRLRVFLAGLVCGLGPMLAEILLEFLPVYGNYGESHPRYKLAIIVSFSLLTVLVPLGTAYAVLVHRVLDVRLIARRALQYALARYSALTLAAVPSLALVGYLYENREEKLIELFSGSPHAAAPLRRRRSASPRCATAAPSSTPIDRQLLPRAVRRAADPDPAGGAHPRHRRRGEPGRASSAREIDLALHLEGISLLVLDPRSGLLTDPAAADAGSTPPRPWPSLIANASDPLPIDLEDPRSPLAEAAREGPPLAGGQRLPADRADPGPRRLAARPDRPRREEERPALPQGGPPAPARHRQQRRLGAGAGAAAAPPAPRTEPAEPGSADADLAETEARPPAGRARQGVPQLRPRSTRSYTVFCSHVQPAAGALARPLRAARQVPLRAADRHRRHGRRLPRRRPRRSAGRWRSRPCAGSPPRTPCGCGARRARRRRSPTATWRRSTAWRPGRGRRCW